MLTSACFYKNALISPLTLKYYRLKRCVMLCLPKRRKQNCLKSLAVKLEILTYIIVVRDFDFLWHHCDVVLRK